MAGYHERFMSYRIKEYTEPYLGLLSEIVEQSIDSYIRNNTPRAVLDLLNSEGEEGEQYDTAYIYPCKIKHLRVPELSINEKMLDEKGKEALELAKRIDKIFSNFDSLSIGGMKRIYNAVFEDDDQKFKDMYEEVM